MFQLFFRNVTLISDNGFLFETNEEIDNISYETNYYDFFEMDSTGNLCSINLYLSNYMKICRRSYI